MKKLIFLICTLAIPVSIFLFLKGFGTNTFVVPNLFEAGIPGCSNSSEIHKVPDISYIGESEKMLNSSQVKGFTVYGVLDVEKPVQINELLVELVRIQDAFYEVGAPYFIIFIKGNPNQRSVLETQCRDKGLLQKNSSIAYLESEYLIDFLRCGIALADEKSGNFTNLVLVDPEKSIRGIYHGLEVEQTDQLVLELKILKRNAKL
jgi:protein SCO1/2